MLHMTVGLCPGGRESGVKSLRRQTSVECDVYLRPQKLQLRFRISAGWLGISLGLCKTTIRAALRFAGRLPSKDTSPPNLPRLMRLNVRTPCVVPVAHSRGMTLYSMHGH